MLDKLQRNLFDQCPRLQAHLGTQIDDIFNSFIEAAVSAGHRMDWTLHLELGIFCGVQDRCQWDELCVAAVSRWVNSGLDDHAWIALKHLAFPNEVFVGLRPDSLAVPGRVFRGHDSDTSQVGTDFVYEMGKKTFTTPTKLWSQYSALLTPIQTKTKKQASRSNG